MARRPVWAEVDLSAVRHNAAQLAALAAPAKLCAVVKAFAYGHGPPVAEAAIAGGAEWLGVATVEEGVQLRQGGISAPLLLLSEPPDSAMGDVVSWRLTPTLYSAEAVAAAAKAVAEYGGHTPLAVHLKVDTGMHRVGATPEDAIALAVAADAAPELRLEGLCTHFAVADEPGNPFTAEQTRRFDETVAALAARGIRPPILHACNSAGTMTAPGARHDLVRCGIALYGLAPSAELIEASSMLRPAMALKARVAYVKAVEPGEAVSYGLHYRFQRRSIVATVPIGYADGVPRRLSFTGGHVLIGGRRLPIAGSVTMDQITVDCGPATDGGGSAAPVAPGSAAPVAAGSAALVAAGSAAPVAAGDEVVLIGQQGDESISAWEWAERLGTIAYEVTCGISARVPRVYLP